MLGPNRPAGPGVRINLEETVSVLPIVTRLLTKTKITMYSRTLWLIRSFQTLTALLLIDNLGSGSQAEAMMMTRNYRYSFSV